MGRQVLKWGGHSGVVFRAILGLLEGALVAPWVQGQGRGHRRRC